MTKKDRQIIEWAAKEQLTEIAVSSKILHEKLSFKEHFILCREIKKLTYKEAVELLIQEDIKEFESKFKKFLKYGLAAIIAIKYGGFKGVLANVVGAPAVGIFILYLFRKLTDTCSRACMNKFPMSKEREVCMLECKIESVRKLTDQLRGEIVKCDEFANPDRCQKKLQKEYIKWSKKLQELLIRLRKVKVDVEAKERRQRQKELNKRKRDILRAGYEIERNVLLNFITENKDLRKRLPFKEHLNLYHKVLCLTSDELSEIRSYVVERKEPEGVNPPSIDPKKEQTFRRVVYLGLWILPVPFFNDFINYLLKKYNYACMAKCVNKPNVPKDFCYKQCRYLSTKMSVDFLEKQMDTCNKHKKPTKCKKKILNLLQDWKQREVDAQVKYEGSLRKHRMV